MVARACVVAFVVELVRVDACQIDYSDLVHRQSIAGSIVAGAFVIAYDYC